MTTIKEQIRREIKGIKGKNAAIPSIQELREHLEEVAREYATDTVPFTDEMYVNEGRKIGFIDGYEYALVEMATLQERRVNGDEIMAADGTLRITVKK